jgi:type II secretory pathway pseudopilin PulG
MDLRRVLQENRGVSLMEVTLAVAIFAGVIAVTAQSLASFYVSIDLQEQRMEAALSCRTVMDAIREKRVQYEDEFPGDLLGWVESGNDAEWAEFLADNGDHVELDEQSIEVACFNTNGDAAGAADNPIMIHVTTTWRDRKGREMSASLMSILTDQ